MNSFYLALTCLSLTRTMTTWLTVWGESSKNQSKWGFTVAQWLHLHSTTIIRGRELFLSKALNHSQTFILSKCLRVKARPVSGISNHMSQSGNHNLLHSTIVTVSYSKWLANSISPIRAKFKEAQKDLMGLLEVAGLDRLYQTKMSVLLEAIREIISSHSLIIFRTRPFIMLLWSLIISAQVRRRPLHRNNLDREDSQVDLVA